MTKCKSIKKMKSNNKICLNIPFAKANLGKLNIKDLSEDSQKRVASICDEFQNVFNFVKDHPKSVTILGSSRFKPGNEHYKRARQLTKKICTLGYTIVTGGGPGIMEAGNRGAFENGCDSVGANIKLPKEQILNPYTNRNSGFHYFFSRKVALFFSAEAYIFFPGGFGTMDEFFELVTLIQTGKVQKVPVILVGKKYWTALDKFINKELYENNKAIDKKDMNLYKIVDSDDEVLKILEKVPMRDE